MKKCVGRRAWPSGIVIFLIPLLFLSTLLPSPGVAQIREIHIKAVGGLQFDKVRFKAEPGERIRIILSNADDMFHNMLITKPGKRESVVEAALNLAELGPQLEFIPKTDDVLWSTRVLAPGEEATLEIKVPSSEGIYPYVCTYPGHGTIMFGAMYVTRGDLPDIKEDVNIPEQRRSASLGAGPNAEDHAHHKEEEVWHPYELVPPYWYRIFMPESGPASIAVNLDDSVFYCWDAGLCRLRYVWEDDFLDISEPWSIKGDARAKVLGEIVYRENQFPLDLGFENQDVAYRGYRLVEGGYPEFYYTINGIDIYELIRPLPGQDGIRRRFRIGSGADKVKLNTQSPDKVNLKSSLGTWTGKELEIKQSSPLEFEVEMSW
ncbi:MAG TPA: hypothetical protein VKZ51_12725 [Cyclobacteriaceae bacterium]|nr:hypothetical protein [Cyclobacteriaceae bacterium]